MYGFIARSHRIIGMNTYEYVMSEPNSYSFLLANNIFLHKKYYLIYQSYIEDWKTLIDKWQSCEDIAMSFMIADLCKEKICAFKIKGTYSENRNPDGKNKYKGLSKRRGHHFQRSFCLNRFAENFNIFPLHLHNTILT